jgi:hypothetical protein
LTNWPIDRQADRLTTSFATGLIEGPTCPMSALKQHSWSRGTGTVGLLWNRKLYSRRLRPSASLVIAIYCLLSSVSFVYYSFLPLSSKIFIFSSSYSVFLFSFSSFSHYSSVSSYVSLTSILLSLFTFTFLLYFLRP